MCFLKVSLIFCAFACPSFGKIFEAGKSKSFVLTRFFDSSKNNDSQQAKMFDEVRRSLKTSAKMLLKEVDCAETVTAECELLAHKTGSSYLLFDDQSTVVDVYYGPHEADYLRRYCLAQLGVKMSRSLPLPAASPGIGMTAKRLNTLTFDDAVATNFSFVIFYASWCPHCQKFKDSWNFLDDHFKDDSLFNIFRVDCMRQEDNDLCLRNKVFGFPTIVLFKDGVWMTEYEGPRDLDIILDFLFSHQTEQGIVEWEEKEKQREADEIWRRAEKAAKKALKEAS